MHVDVAVPVDLCEGEERDVEPTTVVEVELGAHVDHRLGVDRGAQVDALRRDATDGPELDGQGECLVDPFLAGDDAHTVGDPHADVPDVPRGDLEQRPPGDHLAHVQRERLGIGGLHRVVAREEAVDRPRVELRLVGTDHQAVHQEPGHPHRLGVERAGAHHPLHLGDHPSTAVVRRLGQRESVEGGDLVLEAQVAEGVGGRGPDEGDVDGEGGVEEPRLAVDLEQADQLLARHRVQPAAPRPRVDERAQPDVGEDAGLAGRRRPEELGQHALGEVVGLDLAALRQLRQAGGLPPVASDHALAQARPGERGHATLGAVAEPRGVDEGEVARGPGLPVTPGERLDQGRGLVQPATGAEDADGVPVADPRHGVVGRDDRDAVATVLAGARRPPPPCRGALGADARLPGHGRHRSPPRAAAAWGSSTQPPECTESKRAAPARKASRATTIRWISEAPS